MSTKLVPETVHYISLTLKSIWNHLYLPIHFIHKMIDHSARKIAKAPDDLH